MMRKLKIAGVALLVLILAAAAFVFYLHRRALPQIAGAIATAGVSAKVEIIRDPWGVPHIFAENERDGFYGLGWATAQDRLFQIAMFNQAVQGRLAEWFGEPVVQFDKIFRTLDFQGIGKRLYENSSRESRRAVDAYQQGVNDYAAMIDSSLPIEFAILRKSFEPLEPGDLVGMLGFMAFALHDAWRFEPIYARLVEKVGAPLAEQLFPYARGGSPAVYDTVQAPRPRLFELSAEERSLLPFLPRFDASNNWAVAPHKSATGHALLANDPHLGHAHPPIWYQAHLKAGALDVTGVTIPGLPGFVIGHNRDIAWGFTNLMVDAADFFVEKLNPDFPTRVMYKGEWVEMGSRSETIQVRGEEDIVLDVRTTPHGPVVSELIEGTEEVLAYQWVYWSAEGDMDAFTLLNRARNWSDFRAAARRFGSVTQNVAYADREGHIAMQAIGAVPRRLGDPNGSRYRIGWDGSQDWEGFLPFEDLPFELDPPRGWVASANNPIFPGPGATYISAHFEPVDRILRIRERLQAQERFTVEDLRSMQSDTVWTSAVRGLPAILAAYEGQPAPEGNLGVALELLRAWDGDMTAESPAAAIFAVYYERLFHEVFRDELGQELTDAFRDVMNLNASMLWSVTEEGRTDWFDRTDTPQRETEADIVRDALAKAVADLEERLGPDPAEWRWGDLHTLEFVHPLGRLAALAPYFNIGPFPVPGHSNTVNKMQFKPEDWKVYHGPSMRQITDFSDLDNSLGVLPTGQSGVRASSHYDDLAPLWLNGEYHPLLMERARIEEVAEATLTLFPPEPETQD